MEGNAALRIAATDDRGSTAQETDTSLPVPLWTYSLKIGPALVLFYQYCLARCQRAGDHSFETDYGELLHHFGLKERAVKRLVEDLREPLDDDQPDTRYRRLGLLRVSKGKLTGRFTIEPLPPPDLGPRADPTKPSAQRRLPGLAPQEGAPKSAVEAEIRPPQERAPDPAVDLEGLLKSLRARQGEDWWANWCDVGTSFAIEAKTLIANVPHRVVSKEFEKIFRSVIGPTCRDGFPGGESFEIRLLDSKASADFDGGRDLPQAQAPEPAVLFKVKFSSLGSLSGNQENELKVQSLGPQILARAAAIASRFNAPSHFFRWQWVQAAWAVETRRVTPEALEGTIKFCLARDTPHWQYATSIKLCFRHAGVRWLDPRDAADRSGLINRLRACGLEWDEAWEGAPRKPR